MPTATPTPAAPASTPMTPGLTARANNSFSRTGNQQTKLYAALDHIKDDRNKIIDGKLIDSHSITEDYLIETCPKARDYFAAGHPVDHTIENFIKKEMSEREKIDAIKYFLVNEYLAGEQTFYGDVDKAEAEVENRKERYKQKALAIISRYDATLTDLGKDITKIEENIKTIKQRIEDAKRKILEFEGMKEQEAGKGLVVAKIDIPAKIGRLEKKIEEWENELPTQLADLQNAKELTEKFKDLRDKKVEELEAKFGAKNLFLDGSKAPSNSQTQNVVSNSQSGVDNQHRRHTRPSRGQTRQDAAAKAENYYKLTDPQLETMIKDGDLGSFMGTLKNVHNIASARLRTKIDRRLEKAYASNVNTPDGLEYGSITLTLKDLKGIRRLDKTKLDDIQRIVDEHERNYTKKNPSEIAAYDKWFSVIATSLLLDEVGGLERLYERPKDFLHLGNGAELNELKTSAMAYSETKLRVAKARKEIDNRLSTRLKVAQNQTQPTRKAVGAHRKDNLKVSDYVDEAEIG